MIARTFVGHRRGQTLATTEDNKLVIDRENVLPKVNYAFIVDHCSDLPVEACVAGRDQP